MRLRQRLARCFSVSVGTTLLSAAILIALTLGAGVPAGAANVIAVCCGIGPSYLANRHWVWPRVSAPRGVAREVSAFWALSLAGLVASTYAVARVAAVGADWSASARAIALPAANLAVFGALWVAQFVVLDRVLFVNRHHEELVA
jgi:putative flippase GtrA